MKSLSMESYTQLFYYDFNFYYVTLINKYELEYQKYITQLNALQDTKMLEDIYF